MNSQLILRDLGDGLTLRRSNAGDAQALGDFNARIHSDDGPENPEEEVAVWTRDLLVKPHPSFAPDDFTIVEDQRTGKIVSTLNLISQTWSYGGIPFQVGRPELVGTDPEYRQRGLVRAQFELIHEWSAGRGQIVQAITGIPYYYRLFGYEMAMELGGGRYGSKRSLQKLKDGQPEPYSIRPARGEDLEFIAALHRQANQRYLVSCVREPDDWLYELEGKSQNNVNRREIQMIETPEGEPVGYITHSAIYWGPCIVANGYEIKPGIPWSQVTPSVARYLFNTGAAKAAEKGKLEEHDGFGFYLGSQHPVYEVMHTGLPRVAQPYAWYLRVPDLPGFLRRVAPVLEQNLDKSAYQGFSGEVKITFYNQGLLLGLEHGNLAKIESLRPTPTPDSGEAAFPNLTFLQLVFGYCSLDELQYAFADCWCETDSAYGVLKALFPKRPCNCWPVS